MITGDQVRAGRALVRWSARKLADEAGVSLNTIQRMESTSGEPSGLARNIQAVQRALEEAGVLFVAADDAGGPGVRLRKVEA